jgi:hypothetical protein
MDAVNCRISMKMMIEIANAIFEVVGASTTPIMYASELCLSSSTAHLLNFIIIIIIT